MSERMIDGFPHEDTRQPPLLDQRLEHVADLEESYDGERERTPTDDIDLANTITSQRISDPSKHRIILDIDHSIFVVPSSTPGHGHLYIDVDLDWNSYSEILDVLAKHGVIEDGYRGACQRRGYTSVRLPWIKKGEALPTPRCVCCRRTPNEIDAYTLYASEEGYPDNTAFVRAEEGTYNPDNGHFYCDSCYIKRGMPLGKAP